MSIKMSKNSFHLLLSTVFIETNSKILTNRRVLFLENEKKSESSTEEFFVIFFHYRWSSIDKDEKIFFSDFSFW